MGDTIMPAAVAKATPDRNYSEARICGGAKVTGRPGNIIHEP